MRIATGVDFTYYKHSTWCGESSGAWSSGDLQSWKTTAGISSRIPTKRMLCARLLYHHHGILSRTGDFEELKATVFPALLENRDPEDPIRIWVAGCATGEEAYSMAICLTEFLEEAKVSVPFEIFATDISETAIESARAGAYKESDLAKVSPQRLAQFFTRSLRGYQVVKAIRDVCVFARHNLAQDPPFSRLDLISCCNVLIYLGAVLQRKVVSTLHYALKPTGFLILGPSESIGTLSESFHQIDKSPQDLFAGPAASAPSPRLGEGRRAENLPDLRRRTAGGIAGPDVLREADRLVLAEHGPPGAVIDDAMNIVQVRGRTAPYLELSPGEPTQNLLKLAREGLIAGLGKAIRAARQRNAVASENGFRIEDGGQIIDVTIKVIPFKGASSSEERYFLVLFEDAGPKDGRRVANKLPVRITREAPGCGMNW